MVEVLDSNLEVWADKRSKMIFSKVVPQPLGMLKQVVLALFEPMVTRFGTQKDLKQVSKMGPLGANTRSKRGQNPSCPKMILYPCPNYCSLALSMW